MIIKQLHINVKLINKIFGYLNSVIYFYPIKTKAMGYIRHHAIIVTSWNDGSIKRAHRAAQDIFGSLVSEVIDSRMNSYASFFIAPDGSKEGWEDSNEGDDNRRHFIEWIEIQNYSDGSNPIRYCEVFYGDDEDMAVICSHN